LPYKLNKKKLKVPFLSVFNFYYKKFRLFKSYKNKLRPKRHDKISRVVSRGSVYIHQGRV